MTKEKLIILKEMVLKADSISLSLTIPVNGVDLDIKAELDDEAFDLIQKLVEHIEIVED